MPPKKTFPRSKLMPMTSRHKKLQQDLEHITQEMYRRNRELAETNQTLSLLQTINSLALDSSETLGKLANEVATIIADTAGLPLLGIVTTSSASIVDLEIKGLNLSEDRLWQAVVGRRTKINVVLDESWWPKDTPSKLIGLSRFSSAELARALGTNAHTIDRLRKSLGIHSVYLVPLQARDRLVGFMVAGFYGLPEQVRPADITLLNRLSESVGIALDSRLLFEENKRVLVQLRHSNTKLKALDETKDDFISMASHQLRTPLTSVKGYLSMVLDGDVGKLNEQQRKMLTQSYLSSQRMVYLISDLLNLSRLNTGKFVIELSPVDLDEIVQSELDQLYETARARDVKLTYHRVADMPKLMLDETKIRQVVMNLIDNAIYYTPQGGHIQVQLHLTKTGVEFRVKDNGIGVPRAVQHKLFSKFYRADNAQRARPDGTGLGLFMAKKVILAQGGAIIFESEEGKGSTFGFRFSKATHAVPPASAAAPTA